MKIKLVLWESVSKYMRGICYFLQMELFLKNNHMLCPTG
jgi:hypothetical protein